MVKALQNTLLLSAFAITASACSLLNLQGFEIPACTSDLDCNVLNEAEGIDPATACELYQCAEGSEFGGCELRMRDDDEDGAVAASCDGNDCDDNDPLAFPGAPVVATELIGGVAEPDWASWAPASIGGAALSYDLGGNDAGFDVLAPGLTREQSTQVDGASDAMSMFGTISSPALDLGCLSAGEAAPANTFPDDPITPMADRCATHEDCQDGDWCNGYETCDPASAGAAGDAMGCVPATQEPCSGTQQCDGTTEACRSVSVGAACQFAEVAIAPVRDDAFFTAQVQRGGCAVGRVSVGWISSAEAALTRGAPGPNIVARGGEGRAPSFTGIDVADAPACTGRSRVDGAPLGAAGVALASLPQDVANGRLRPQALVAWQAAPTCRHIGGCTDEAGATGAVRVEVIGAWDEQQAGSNDITRWVSVTGSGAQQPLGTSTSGNSRPAVTAVDAGANAGYVVAYGAAGGGIVARWIPAFSDPDYFDEAAGEFGVFADSAPYPTRLATGSAVSRTRSTPPIADLGSDTMLTDSGDADAVVLAAGPVGPMTEMLMAWVESGAVFTAKVTLDAAAGTLMAGIPTQVSGPNASRPEVVYVERGLCGPDCGGFALTWVEGGQGQLARYLENGDALDTTPVVIGEASFVRAYQSEGALQVAWHEPSGQRLLISNGQCPPSTGGE
ncbi:MAG: hypothetical protein AB8I08_18355 [Sandaracinaceae bacterium]